MNELFVYLQASMPPAGRKPSDESFTNIIAYILERNGQEAGSARLVATATTRVPTRDVVAGRAAPAAAPATAARVGPTRRGDRAGLEHPRRRSRPYSGTTSSRTIGR